MQFPTDVIRGALKVENIPDMACFESFTELLKALPDWISVEIPSSVSNVVIGLSQPADSQRDSLWVRVDANNNFIGFFLFILGGWKQILPPPNQVIWMYGRSDQIPQGYQLVDNNNAHFTTSEVQALQAHYILGSTGTYYSYFAVTWAGF